jgi:hypothetical protein
LQRSYKALKGLIRPSWASYDKVSPEAFLLAIYKDLKALRKAVRRFQKPPKALKSLIKGPNCCHELGPDTACCIVSDTYARQGGTLARATLKTQTFTNLSNDAFGWHFKDLST